MGGDVHHRTAEARYMEKDYLPQTGIHRWQTISGDKGSDNQTKTPPAVERLSHNTKRKPLVCFLFDLKKEVFCVCPPLPKKGSSWWISFFPSHLFYVILVLSFLILITFLIYSALKNWWGTKNYTDANLNSRCDLPDSLEGMNISLKCTNLLHLLDMTWTRVNEDVQ